MAGSRTKGMEPTRETLGWDTPRSILNDGRVRMEDMPANALATGEKVSVQKSLGFLEGKLQAAISMLTEVNGPLPCKDTVEGNNVEATLQRLHDDADYLVNIARSIQDRVGSL